MMADALLQDRRVLVVEDEFMVADAVERKLRRAGAVVLGPVPSVAQALRLLEQEADIDGAVLDINLGDHKVYPVVDMLLARGTPCVFATGNDRADVPRAYAHLIRCEKPIDAACLVSALAGVAASAPDGADTATPRRAAADAPAAARPDPARGRPRLYAGRGEIVRGARRDRRGSGGLKRWRGGRRTARRRATATG